MQPVAGQSQRVGAWDEDTLAFIDDCESPSSRGRDARVSSGATACEERFRTPASVGERERCAVRGSCPGTTTDVGEVVGGRPEPSADPFRQPDDDPLRIADVAHVLHALDRHALDGSSPARVRTA